jgi:hypothetical protein
MSISVLIIENLKINIWTLLLAAWNETIILIISYFQFHLMYLSIFVFQCLILIMIFRLAFHLVDFACNREVLSIWIDCLVLLTQPLLFLLCFCLDGVSLWLYLNIFRFLIFCKYFLFLCFLSFIILICQFIIWIIYIKFNLF